MKFLISTGLNHNQASYIPEYKAVIPLDEGYNHEKVEEIHEGNGDMIKTIDISDFQTTLEEEDPNIWPIQVDSPLTVKDLNSVFNFELGVEDDNLGEWIFRAEISSVKDKIDRIAKKAYDTEYIRLTVKE